jgi:hypothetical protein
MLVNLMNIVNQFLCTCACLNISCSVPLLMSRILLLRSHHTNQAEKQNCFFGISSTNYVEIYSYAIINNLDIT